MFCLVDSIDILFIGSSSRFTSEITTKKEGAYLKKLKSQANDWPSYMEEGSQVTSHR